MLVTSKGKTVGNAKRVQFLEAARRQGRYRDCMAGSGVETVHAMRGAREKKAASATLAARFRSVETDAQAVSPYTETEISTTTSVCKATLTLVSPTSLIGPLGMRTWDFTTL